MNFMNKFFILIILLSAMAIAGCKKEFDTPPVKILPVGSVLSIAELRALYVDKTVKIIGDSSIYAIVTADERSGNLYKNIFIEDNTGAINVRLNNSGGLYEGDSIRIYLKNCYVSRYNGMLQLDSVSADNNVVKQATGRKRQPLDATIDQLKNLQARLVRINQCEFTGADLGKTWSDAVNQSTQNRTLTDCNGNTVLVRSSGYASFANQVIPSGNGSLIAVVSEFNGDMQLYIRNPAELNMNADRCTGGGSVEPVATVQEAFDNVGNNSDFGAPGWLNIATTGTRYWRGRVFNTTEKYIQIGSFQSTDASNLSWLITPPVIASNTKKLSFKSAVAFWTHNSLEVLISTDFDGSNPLAANWSPVSATLASQSSGNYAWVNSGDIDLTGYFPQGFTGNFHIAFRYSGSAPENKTGTSALDDIYIRD
jgi:hypothetical protein